MNEWRQVGGWSTEKGQREGRGWGQMGSGQAQKGKVTSGSQEASDLGFQETR